MCVRACVRASVCVCLRECVPLCVCVCVCASVCVRVFVCVCTNIKLTYQLTIRVTKASPEQLFELMDSSVWGLKLLVYEALSYWCSALCLMPETLYSGITGAAVRTHGLW